MTLLSASSTVDTSCFATGSLGWEFGLTLRQSVVIIVASLLGGPLTCYCATFSAATSLRQIAVVMLAVVSMIYERYAWTIFLIIFSEAGPYTDRTNRSSDSDLILSGSRILANTASHYYVHYPATVSRVIIATFGIGLHTSIGMVANCNCQYTYEDQGLGYLIQPLLRPRGIANYCSSSAISFKQLDLQFSCILRSPWALFCFACILPLAVGGLAKLIAGVNLIASTKFLLGLVACCVGMSQTRFVGPLAKMLGAAGRDVANQLTFVVTVANYAPARYVKLKIMRR
ncbi:hypothetical protein BDW66DRAFT_163719 [Aspergillus desertorum]